MPQQDVGVLHPGEMGASIAASLIDAGCHVYWASEGRRPQSVARAEAIGLRDAGTIAELCARCPIVLSVCPPEFAFDVAKQVKATGFRGVFADLNALAPQNKIELGRDLEAAGIRFVDGGIIGLPSRVKQETTVFLSGEAAGEVSACLDGGAIAGQVLGLGVGRATALKVLFAAYNKGSIALFASLYAAAEQYGVLAELQGQFRHRGLSVEKIDTQILRAAPKAWRWVPEMREISAALEAVGLPGAFHQGAEEIYRRLADLKDTQPSMERVLEDLKQRA